MPVTSRDREAGFTMVATVIAMSIVMLLAAVAVTAVNGDTHLTRHDLDSKQAYEAAKAGIDDYAFHLDADSSYWTECTEVPSPTRSTSRARPTKRRPVPGDTGADLRDRTDPGDRPDDLQPDRRSQPRPRA